MKSKLVFPRISNMPAPSKLNAQLFHFSSLIYDIEDDLRADQRGKEVNGDTEAQGHGESLDRASPEQEERHARDQGGDVGVNDGQQRLVIASINRQPNRVPLSKFFPDALK